jgi:hypothetical protein
MTLCLYRDIKSGLRSELSSSLYLSKCSAVPVVGPDFDEDERSLVLLTKPPSGFTVCISIWKGSKRREKYRLLQARECSLAIHWRGESAL